MQLITDKKELNRDTTSTRYKGGFYQYPRFLVRENISDRAKSVYLLLLDRLRMSEQIPRFHDKFGRPFVYYPVSELMEDFGVSRSTITRAMTELEEHAMISRENQGLGRPNIIYVTTPAQLMEFNELLGR